MSNKVLFALYDDGSSDCFYPWSGSLARRDWFVASGSLARRDWFLASGSQILCYFCGGRGVFFRPTGRRPEDVVVECGTCGASARWVDLVEHMRLDLVRTGRASEGRVG